MIEQTVAIESVPGVECRAIQLTGDEFFHVLVSEEGADRWVVYCEDVQVAEYLVLTDPQATQAVKASILFGEPWEDIEDDPAENLAAQQSLMDLLAGSGIEDRMIRSQTDEVREYAATIRGLSPGEMLWIELTGVDPVALRN